ncbi:hypothetical protein [Arthrobacter antibioticus]|uniref:hypothetical protein n=1 Tax=Arthrobacter sp. H35-MC1 TaxID=3046203 RepID=UPI0024BAF184|nr:hypothetical protein [Arthrobacter sp. H35-MC1]MDJ0316238.1 hypothetical protein [Arthrobacter sp. H35-MC1]
MLSFALLKKSRLIQFTTASVIFFSVFAILYVFADFRIFLFFVIIYLLLMITVLMTRVVQLEWRTTTTEKSETKRRLANESLLNEMRLEIQRELHEELRLGRAKLPANSRSARDSFRRSTKIGPSDGPVVGRLAAAVAETNEYDNRLFELLNPGKQCVVAGILSANLRHALEDHYSVCEVLPGVVQQQLSDSNASMLVIDQHAFQEGAWFGADSASESLLNAQIIESIELAKTLDMIVCYISTGAVARPYSNSIRSVADAVFGADAEDTDWSESIGVRFVTIIDSYVSAIDGKSKEVFV